ncbi:tRNA (adenine(58)-N(1))-methyltransferase catalytic subunit TRMT61A [Vespula squamosa]|uniref:tRNA (adenine(58)-N(1))-methyltransferase catalytic subunit TRMT61A n=1 Tax=Vespula squamosa TaxID=30214 RepID=A0ABD2AJQ2_VESSQ
MSFKKTKEMIEEGDVIILYLGPGNMHSLEVTPKTLNKKGIMVENVFQTIYGALKVVSLVGQKYGSKVQLSRGWGYVLQPTPELWTLTVPHRTQIIYSPDISLIIHLMELSPGQTIIETGTGSGSLSHALIRAIRPAGHLYTFDFHEQRVNIASAEFKRHGLDDFVTVECRDVCAEGFGKKVENKIDAIFLDLPHPWLVIKRAINALKITGGKLCSFSPCIEQVQRTCAELALEGFIEINTYECLQRELTVQYKNLPVLNLDCLKYKQEYEKMKQANVKEKQEQEKFLTVTHAHSLPGHTGFITIATLSPIHARSLKEEEDKF